MLEEKNPRPQISVVVLNFNGLCYLTQTIPPLLRVNYPNTEIIVVDNCSTDNSLQYLASLAAPNLTVVRNSTNSGYCLGKNLGVKKARGEYILLLDEDTKIDAPEILNELLQLYHQLPKIGFLGLLIKEKEDTDTTKLYCGFIRRFSIFSNKPLPINKLLRLPYHEASTPDGQALFFRKAFWEELGGYETSQPYYIDAGDVGMRASIFGYHTYVYDKRIFNHLGKVRKVSKESWLWKYGYHFSGISRMMFKNYRLSNLLLSYPFFCVFSLAKTVLNAFRYKDVRVILRELFSIRLFFINLKSTLAERKRLQSQRTTVIDHFLHIKPPLI